MPVTLTSPAVGKQPGDTHTGPEEAWLLAEGYASQAAYTGPGVSNTGPATVDPDQDLTLASNREGVDETFDVDPGGVDNDPPANVTLAPNSGPAAGGTVVTLTGDHLAGVTSVTFGGVAGTALDTSGATRGEGGTITVTTPAGTAGAKDVVLVDASGNLTLTGGYTYV